MPELYFMYALSYTHMFKGFDGLSEPMKERVALLRAARDEHGSAYLPRVGAARRDYVGVSRFYLYTKEYEDRNS